MVDALISPNFLHKFLVTNITLFDASHVCNKLTVVTSEYSGFVSKKHRVMGRNSKHYGIHFDRRSQNFVFNMIAWSQLIADGRKRSQKIQMMVLSCAIVCDHHRRIVDDRRSVFPYDRRRSQNFLRSAISWSAIVCDHVETSLNTFTLVSL